MNRFSYFLIAIFFILSGCAGKKIVMKNEAIRTAEKLRVGVVELSSQPFDASVLNECLSNYPSTGFLFDSQARHELESEGWASENMIASLQNQDFQAYQNVKKFSLLLLLFQNKEQKSFIRLINFLSQKVQTLSLSPEQFSCENILAAAKLLVVDSTPPFADVYINDRRIGEAPVWTSLQDGIYDIQCKLPDDTFPTKTLKEPGTIEYLCRRGNSNSQSMENDEVTTSEKAQSVFLYGIIGAGSLASIVVPYLLLR